MFHLQKKKNDAVCFVGFEMIFFTDLKSAGVKNQRSECRRGVSTMTFSEQSMFLICSVTFSLCHTIYLYKIFFSRFNVFCLPFQIESFISRNFFSPFVSAFFIILCCRQVHSKHKKKSKQKTKPNISEQSFYSFAFFNKIITKSHSKNHTNVKWFLIFKI